MPSILIDLDEATLRALNQVAPATKQERTAFIQQALKTAIRERENARIREGYRQSPDSQAEADDWTTAEKFEA